jgi:hypothetical protein
MADTVKIENLGEGTHEAIAYKLLLMVSGREQLDTRQKILDAYVDCRSATYGHKLGGR